MRFLVAGQPLHRLGSRTRMLVLVLALGIALQLVSGLAMQHRGPGWTTTTIAAHYLGTPPDLAATVPANALDAGTEVLGTPPRSFDALLEVAHMHLVWMPLLVFLAAHLFSMTPWGAGTWGAVLGYGTLAAALADIAAPFLVRYGGSAWAPAKLLAVVALALGELLMCAGVIAACLMGRGERQEPAEG